jgi:RNA polymerase sigma factor (sigma-70 family)
LRTLDFEIIQGEKTMTQNTSFWPEQNGWWAMAAARMADKSAPEELWAEAGPRIRALIGRVNGAESLSREDIGDLTQSVLLRLCQSEAGKNLDDELEADLLQKLTQQNAPAHYLRNAIHNLMLNDSRRERRAKANNSALQYTEITKRIRDRDPAKEAEQNEACKRVRFVVNHVIGREEREILVLRYFDGLMPEEIAKRLKLSHAAVLKRLFRAKNRVKIELSNLNI